ncbi:TIGR02266 family protein [Hyalangium minutum]|uniref:Type IV pilus assembly protein PilZ n=1 Tax=Hyalangium minutum TaxID=394096 RepID=A0A085VTX9_9BACT|nr:TIGR02266 family protein [Hyalangium minutum]KFE58892.1 type IV pilus assembly protein PilZ [Hyalangium minutum]
MNSNSADVRSTGQDDLANRRTEERVPARFEVHFNDTQEAAKALRAYSLNVSAGGLCLRTRRAYDVGSPVRMDMVVEGQAFQLQGVIAWVRDESEAIGVRFTDISEKDRSRLQSVIDSLKR